MLELDRLLEEQTRYYEDRAPEYEDVWYRRGPYDLGSEGNARWFEETARLEAAADAFGATGEVLELACGTGLFTRRLVREATRLTAIDVSKGVLEINRRRVADPSVVYVHGDLFEWEPPAGRRYDAIFSSFLLSHIPPSRFAEFWGRLGRWLEPGGRVFICDDLEGGEARPSNPERRERPAVPPPSPASHGSRVHDRQGLLPARAPRRRARGPRVGLRDRHDRRRVLPRDRVARRRSVSERA
jgi:SAM-dependent methyltransferase